jgi:RNA polymerase sigma-B factor
VVRFRGEVELSTRRLFAAAVDVGTTARACVLDLREVTFIDCWGLVELAQAARRAETSATDLKLLPGTALDSIGSLLRSDGAALDRVIAGADLHATARIAAGGHLVEIVLSQPEEGVFALGPRGEIDDDRADLLGTVADSAADAVGAVVIDLAGVRYLGAPVVRALVRAHRRASANRVRLRLADGRPSVLRILQTTDTDGVLEWYGSVAEAMAPTRRRDLPHQQSRSGRHHQYENLAPLFAERAALPESHPRRRVLRTQLITGYLPVARHIARKHLYRGENLDDLEQVATLGLINAVDRFDPERGVDFLSFAVPTINGEVQRHYRDRTSTIRVPRSIREVQFQVFQAVDELSQGMGRAPTPSELASRLDIDVNTVIEAVQAAYETRPSSLDEPQLDDEPGSAESTRFTRALGVPDHDLDLVEDRESLAPLLDGLAAREREIVLLRFYGNMTQTEIAQRVGISQMHVSRLLSATLARLREQLNSDEA